MALSLRIERLLDVTVMELCGRVTLGEGSVVLRNAVRKAVWNGHRKFALDYGDITYQDSSGNGEIVSAFTVVRNAGGQLVLYSLTRKMRDLLQVTKLYTVFNVLESRDEAIKYFDESRTWEVQISERRYIDVAVLEVQGALTERYGAAKVTAATRAALSAGAKSVILLSPQLLEIDRFGADNLLAAESLVRAQGGELVLAGAEDRLLPALTDADVSGVLRTYETIDAALDVFGLKAVWDYGRVEVVRAD
jgi:anti-sigma B factor antagonist